MELGWLKTRGSPPPRDRLAGSCAFLIRWFISPSTTPSSKPSEFFMRYPCTGWASLLNLSFEDTIYTSK